MTIQVKAVYENSLLRPLASLPLAEHQHIKVTVSKISGDPLASMIDQPFGEHSRKEVVTAGSIPTHEKLRWMTAKDPTSWAGENIAESIQRFSRLEIAISKSRRM